MTTLASDFFRLIATEIWVFEGPDALRFLNGITTAHLSRTEPGTPSFCGRGLFLDPKGKILAPFIFLKASELRILLRLDIGCHTREPAVAELNQSLFDHVAALIIADDLQVSRHPAAVAQVWGNTFKEYAPRNPLPCLRPQAQDVLSVPGTYLTAHCLPTPHLGPDSFELWPRDPDGDLPDFVGKELSTRELEERFFAARYLEFPNELRVGDLPLEFGFVDAISFFKGCYRGQEIIARVTYRGKLVKGLCELEFAKALEVKDTQLINTADQIVGELRVVHDDRKRAFAVLRFDAGEGVCTAIAKNPVLRTERLAKEVNELFR